MLYFFFFFFSSRRRHTRLQGDWSSDVCSSDLVSREHLAVERAGRRTWVRDLPISVPSEEIAALAALPETAAAGQRIRSELGLDGCKVGLGVDRLDYTKGIPERLEALERMFETHPEWRRHFAFIQIAV